jgi:8-oxo-dGTP pyrophosphatase MutT (NUDIX family)
VLTQREARLRRHGGEISFPGGRHEASDGSLLQTALREAEEEIGLSGSDVRVLGGLAVTRTFLTNYAIHPFVGLITAGKQWEMAPREVDAVLEVSLKELRDSRVRTRLERRGLSFETDAYQYGEHLIWGATARILDDLLRRLEGVSVG